MSDSKFRVVGGGSTSYITKSTFAEVVKVISGNPTLRLLFNPKRTIEYLFAYYRLYPIHGGVKFGILFDDSPENIEYISIPAEGKPLVDAIVSYVERSPLVTNVVESDDFV